MPTVTDQIVSDAKSLTALADAAKTQDPALYSHLTGAYAAQSWWAPLVAGISWVGTHWGLGWDATTASLIAGVIAAGGTGVYHWFVKRSAPSKG